MNGAKPNMQPRGARMTFFRMESVALDNGDEDYPEGDKIGVATAWKPPDAFDDVTLNDLARVQAAINAREEPPAQSPQNHDWVGYVVADVLGLDVGKPGSARADRDSAQNRDRVRVTTMIKEWLRSKALRRDNFYDGRNGREVKVIVVGEPAVDLSQFNGTIRQPHSPHLTAEQLRTAE